MTVVAVRLSLGVPLNQIPRRQNALQQGAMRWGCAQRYGERKQRHCDELTQGALG